MYQLIYVSTCTALRNHTFPFPQSAIYEKFYLYIKTCCSLYIIVLKHKKCAVVELHFVFEVRTGLKQLFGVTYHLRSICGDFQTDPTSAPCTLFFSECLRLKLAARPQNLVRLLNLDAFAVRLGCYCAKINWQHRYWSLIARNTKQHVFVYKYRGTLVKCEVHVQGMRLDLAPAFTTNSTLNSVFVQLVVSILFV